jgi:hypothetical protein
MCKDFWAELFSVLLLLLLCTSGCQVAGGGFGFHSPPKNIVCGQPWVISFSFYVVPIDPKEKYGKLTERYKDVVIHIHYSSDTNFITVPMVVESANPKTGELRMKADMKPIPCDANIEYVGYRMDCMLNNHYNQSKYYIVPVSKD